MRIDLQVDSAKAETLLKRLEQAGINPLPVMLQIGEHLVETTKERFRSSRAPDGSPWAPNKLTTIQNDRSRFGAGRGGTKKPLIGESRSLSTTINYRRYGATGVEIGSPMESAAVQQFGARKGAFGTTRRGAPIPWGDIPARPFLGISDEDRTEIELLLFEFLEDQAGS